MTGKRVNRPTGKPINHPQTGIELSMNSIPFTKMSGSGNDFIIIDNRENRIDSPDVSGWVAKVCRRAMSVGADGLILVENTRDADFRWRFFNADGSVAEMCGNGARCVARFAYENGIAGAGMRFETDAGIVSAQVDGHRVRLKMTDPEGFRHDYDLPVAAGTLRVSSVNTGVPHVVVPVADVALADVTGQGREIRYHPAYAPAGTNVNFISPLSDGVLAIRTYERGVENETLACGTGAVASALVWSAADGHPAPISLKTRSGGVLTIHFSQSGGRFTDVYLEGDARVIYRGELLQDAWMYP